MKYNNEIKETAEKLLTLLIEKGVLSEDENIDTEETLNDFISSILNMGIIMVEDEEFVSSLANSLEELVKRVITER